MFAIKCNKTISSTPYFIETFLLHISSSSVFYFCLWKIIVPAHHFCLLGLWIHIIMLIYRAVKHVCVIAASTCIKEGYRNSGTTDKFFEGYRNASHLIYLFYISNHVSLHMSSNKVDGKRLVNAALSSGLVYTSTYVTPSLIGWAQT